MMRAFLRKASWWGGWLCLCVWLLWLCGCAPVEQIQTMYPRLRIQLHSDQVRWLRVQITTCQGERATQSPLLRERAVEVPLGVEDFFLPQLPLGDVDLLVEAFSQQAVGSSNGPTIGFIRQRWTRTMPSAAYADLSLQQGIPPLYALCALPPPLDLPLPPPVLPESWLPSTPSSAYPWLAPTTNGLPELPRRPDTTPQTPQLSRLHQLPTVLSLPAFPLQMHSNGQQLLLLQTSPPALRLVDLRVGYPQSIGTFDLPKDCQPRDLALFGTQAAILCVQPARLHWLDFASALRQDPWRVHSPAKGFSLPCQQPSAVRFWGDSFVVACFDTHEVLFLHPRDEQLAVLLKMPVGEGPVRLAHLDGSFFVLNALSNDISSFRIAPNLSRKEPIASEQITTEVTRSTHRQPLEMAVNAHYLVTLSASENNIMVRSLPLRDDTPPRYLSVPQGTSPRHIQLLGHTAILSMLDREELVVIDLQQQTTTQRLSLHRPSLVPKASTLSLDVRSQLMPRDSFPLLYRQPSTPIALAGTHVFAALQYEKALRSFVFSEHSGFLQWRWGTFSHTPLVADATSQTPYVWLFQQESQRLLALDLRRKDFPKSIDSIPTPAWVRLYKDHLVFVDQSLRRVGVRSLQDPDLPVQFVTLEQDICDGELNDGTLYLLHCRDASLTRLRFLQDTHPARLFFLDHLRLTAKYMNLQVQGIGLFEHQQQLYLLTFDTASRLLALYPIPAQSTKPIEPSRKLVLPGLQSGLQQLLKRSNQRFSLLTQLGRIYEIDAFALIDPQNNLDHAVMLDLFSGRMQPYGRDLLLTDPYKNQLLLFDPSRQEIRKRLAIDSFPTSITPLPQGALIDAHGNQSLLFVPLPPARP